MNNIQSNKIKDEAMKEENNLFIHYMSTNIGGVGGVIAGGSIGVTIAGPFGAAVGGAIGGGFGVLAGAKYGEKRKNRRTVPAKQITDDRKIQR